MGGEGVGSGGGVSGSGDTFSERSSMARVRANRRAQLMQRQPPSQQSMMSYQSVPPPPPPPPAQVSSAASGDAPVSSHKTNQDKALITLLGEMRELEKKLNAQAAEFEAERQQFRDTINQQKQQMETLQQSNQQLAAAKHQAEHTLRKVFTQLDRFSQGCWQFPSNSVKKMSEALHTQLLEWRRTINEEELSAEEEFMEKSTMEKMQTVHLEVKQLREENLALKKKQTRDRKVKQHSTSSRSVGSVVSGGDGGDDDEQSNLSGMSTTILSGMMESPRLKAAMSGFLRSPSRPSPPTRKNKESPTSILKQSSRYDSRNNSAYQQRSSKPSLPPRQNHTSSSSKKVARFAGVNDTEFECNWGEAESEV